MPENLVSVAINRATDLQRDQVQDLVSKHAEAWWHGFDDLWLIADDRTAFEWRDLLGAIFLRGPGHVLVIEMGEPSALKWASRAKWTDSQQAWLQRWLSGVVESDAGDDDIPF